MSNDIRVADLDTGVIACSSSQKFPSAHIGMQMASDQGGPGAVTPADALQKQASGPRPSRPEIHLQTSNLLPRSLAVKVEKPHIFNPNNEHQHQITKIFINNFQNSNFQAFEDKNPFNAGQLAMGHRRFSKRRVVPKITHSVEKRNARERTRVHTVNQAFGILKLKLPTLRSNTKRVSKLKILRTAIDYIDALKTVLTYEDNNPALTSLAFQFDTTSKRTNPSFNKTNLIKSAAAASKTTPTAIPTNLGNAVAVNNPAALIKLPYVSYDNLYSSPYMPYTAYMSQTVPQLQPQPAAYPTDVNMFYYNQGNDYSTLNGNSFF